MNLLLRKKLILLIFKRFYKLFNGNIFILSGLRTAKYFNFNKGDLYMSLDLQSQINELKKQTIELQNIVTSQLGSITCLSSSIASLQTEINVLKCLQKN